VSSFAAPLRRAESDRRPTLDSAQIAQFAEDGYLILPALLPDDLVARLKDEVDTWVDTGLRAKSIAAAKNPDSATTPPDLEIELRAHGELVAHPPLMSVLAQIMGTEFVFHHLHSDRHAPGIAGKAWHHDYEQRPIAERTHLMVHALHYVDGLDEDTAALTVLPGSQHEVAAKTARAHLGTDVLAGERVVGRLPSGSTVLLHSALFHARRPHPSGGRRARYFIDASYCQVGTLWPPVKPYWRHTLRRGRELGLNRGRWPELFAERHFSEYVRPS
jgi:ectoine hydroxylase-related dioxygenase (phytanoyl-CoA dioxygenase family)